MKLKRLAEKLTSIAAKAVPTVSVSGNWRQTITKFSMAAWMVPLLQQRHEREEKRRSTKQNGTRFLVWARNT